MGVFQRVGALSNFHGKVAASVGEVLGLDQGSMLRR